MVDDDYSSAKNFFSNIMTPDDVLPLNILVKRICRAPPAARRYLERHCRDVQELEEFFKDNDYLFYMENKRVALFDEQLENESERAVDYFKQRLKKCDTPVHYMELKQHFVDHAPRSVCQFISQFYPAKEIKHFFSRRPDVFVVHKNHTVFLVEIDSLNFFRRKLKALKGQKVHFMQFRGNIGQADPHVQKYINKYFLGDDFQDFLRQHSDVFSLDDDGFLSLVSPE